MPINPNILLGAQPMQIQQVQPVDQLNQLAKVMQLKAADTQMREQERVNTDRNALRQIYGSTPADQLENALLTKGYSKESFELGKQRRENAQTDATTEKTRIETAHKRVDAWGQAMGFVRQNPTPENATFAVRHLVTMGIIPPEQAQSALAGVRADPQSIAQWATQGFQAALSAKDQLPTYQTRNLGGTTDTLAINPVTQQVQTVNSARNTMSPDAVAADSRARATLAETQRHHGAMEGNAAQTLQLQRETKVDGKPLSGSDLKQLQEVRDNAVTLDRLLGGFKDDFASKGVFGMGADASLAAKAVVGSDKDAVEWWKNYRKQAELVERHAMFGASLTPGEQQSWRNADIGPGMDKEVIKQNLQTRAKLTKQMLETTRQDLVDAGRSESRVNAIAGRGPKEQTATNVHKVTSDADYAALPSGTVFVGPDGKQRRKP